MSIFLSWLWGKVSIVSLKTWAYIAAFFALLAALAKVYNAGKNAEKVAEVEKNAEIKDEQLQRAMDRPNTDDALDSRLRDPSREF